MTKGIWLTMILTVLLSSLAAADIPKRPQQHEGADIERELQKYGVEIDTASVMAAAESHRDRAIRLFAVNLLGRRRDSSAAEFLRHLLVNDPNRLIREAAALALVRLGDADALENVKEFIVTSESHSRRLYLIGQLAGEGVLDFFHYVAEAAVSNEEDPRFLSSQVLVAYIVAGFEGSAEQASPQDLLLALLRDPSAKVRGAAMSVIGVGEWKGLDVEPYLQDVRRIAARDPDAKLRDRARLQLSSWTASRQEEEE